MSISHTANRALLDNYRTSLYEGDVQAAALAIEDCFSKDTLIQLGFPFETLEGRDALAEVAFKPLLTALPDLERRDLIVMAGPTHHGTDWIGCCGYYTGTFLHPWLDIPPTGHQVALRFHEFYRVVDAQVVEVQALWDIPELMLQAGVWPLAPSLGCEWHVPGPATQDGLSIDPWQAEQAASSEQIVLDMVEGLGRYAEGGVAAMELDRYWHPHCNWYGPSGIGTARGIQGFRKWHQIPFLAGMPSRVSCATEGNLFADREYVAFTAWPGMHMTISNDGWLGIPPTNKKITMRSLDFWRIENGMIRENWVLIDLLDVYHQIGVDVFNRMRERTMNYAIS